MTGNYRKTKIQESFFGQWGSPSSLVAEAEAENWTSFVLAADFMRTLREEMTLYVLTYVSDFEVHMPVDLIPVLGLASVVSLMGLETTAMSNSEL